MLDQRTVVVWEWQDAAFWKPYSPQVTCYVEKVIHETPRASSVSLGEADPSLTSYILDLISMNQFRLDTGILFSVRRVIFPLCSAPGQGVTWEREVNPTQWVPFETRLSVLIHQAFERKQLGVRLGEPCTGSHICFQTMTQLEFPSQKRVRVRARTHSPYPLLKIKCGIEKSHFITGYSNRIRNSKKETLILNLMHGNPSNGPSFGHEKPSSSEPYRSNQKSAISSLQNTNQVLVNETGGVNNLNTYEFTNRETEVINPSCLPFNFSNGLVNVCTSSLPCNNNLINGNHVFLSSNNNYMHSTARLLNSDDEQSNCQFRAFSPRTILPNLNPALINSDGKSKSSSREIASISGGVPNNLANSVSEPFVSDSRNVLKPRILRSDIKTADCRVEIINSESKLTNNNPFLVRSNTGTGLCQPDFRPVDFKPQFVRLSSIPNDSCIKPTRPDSETDVSNPALNRSNYRHSANQLIYGKSDSRYADANYILDTSDDPKHVAKNSNAMPFVIQSPPCPCPQCVLVHNIKSYRWPTHQLSTKTIGIQKSNSQRTEAAKGRTRILPLPLCNIKGSGMIQPALAGISGLLMSSAGLPVCLSIPSSPVFYPPTIRKKDIQPVPGVLGTCRKVCNKKGKKPEQVIKQFLQRVKIPLMEDCILCLKPLANGEVGKLYRCCHSHHVRCLAHLYKDGILRCPSCQTLYGSKIGSQPPGKMCYHLIPYSLPGHADCQTIRIIYHISPGIQGPGQPNPGTKFTVPDFPLHCYLPNTDKGRKVLRLLIQAWERRILFPVIPSKVPGIPDSVSISRFPHKTEFGSNLTGKGFPDSQYLDSVLRQLQDWGVTGD
ncbi:hypothetical protein XENTR_v10018486 [Xenopus tropicalis]|uniref:E3 ubiquitin-protein ligase n=1 Tax=Xenopus tropicalis TaxID=8364 RepID=A0A6I8SBZ2_XENTR|nr:E3 ubiquitin-protein ligase DTX4 [Xenopus tropicalis]KAE8591541.1 hypothetical protein XENTR_v10018486 [Xenopus tropicalis]|eukprot:XP_004910945.2 PREDICTED: E3 ubiquitin-protein ligase DTX4 [Xenopus tropicalis]